MWHACALACTACYVSFSNFYQMYLHLKAGRVFFCFRDIAASVVMLLSALDHFSIQSSFSISLHIVLH